MLRWKLRESSDRAASFKRLVHDERVLWDLLAARVRAFRPGACAAARERRFRQASSTYSALRDRPADAVGAESTVIAGIRWLVPLDRRTPNRLADRIVNRGWLPLAQILQTREIAGGGVMIDIGANVGTTAIPRVFLGDAQVVYAAEPEPANYRSLVFNVVENGLAGVVLPDCVAIGGIDGTAHLLPAESIGGHRVLAAPMERKHKATQPVRMLTLDSWTASLGIDEQAIRFIKVDTQGTEAFILAGAPRILSLPHVAWQLEIAPVLIERAGATLRDLVAQLQRHFTDFIDLQAGAPGSRVRPVAEAGEALAYLQEKANTNILVWRRGR